MLRGLSTCLGVASMALVLLLAPHSSADEASANQASNAVGPTRTITVDDLLAMRRIGGYRGGLLLSPDAARAAIRRSEVRPESDTYSYSWLVVSLGGGARPLMVGEGGEPVQRPSSAGSINGHPEDPVAAWSPDGAQFAYLAQHGGIIQLWVSDLVGATARPLVATADDVNDFAWSPDGKSVLVTFDATRRLVREARARALVEGFRLDEHVSPLTVLAPLSPKSPSNEIWQVDVVTGQLRPADADEGLIFQDAKAPARVPGHDFAKLVVSSPSSGAVAWGEPPLDVRQAERPPLHVLATRKKGALETLRCPSPSCIGQIERIWWSANDTVLFVRREGHADSVRGFYAWNIATGAVQALYRSEDALLDCSIMRGLTLACLHETVIQPRRIVALDLRTANMETLFDANPEFRDISFTPIERLDVRDKSGHESFAHLVYPAGFRENTKYPLAIVQYRSNGFLIGGTGDEYPVHVLAQHGFFVLSVDRPEHRALEARLPSEEVQRRTESDYTEQTSKQVALEILIDRLSARGLVDTRRIGITGLSDGAETVFWGLTYSKRFACAAVSSPPVDPLNWELASATMRQRLRGSGVRSPNDPREPFGRAWWHRSSARYHLDRFNVPLLMNLGESEALAGAPLHASLSDLGRPVETYIYPGEHHIKARPSMRRAVYARNLDWLDFWLRRVEDPAPAKAAQYVRWRALRLRQCDSIKGDGAPWYCRP